MWTIVNFWIQAEDGGVSRDELTAVLLSSLESAQTILDNMEDTAVEQLEEGEETDKLIETVTRWMLCLEVIRSSEQLQAGSKDSPCCKMEWNNLLHFSITSELWNLESGLQ